MTLWKRFPEPTGSKCHSNPSKTCERVGCKQPATVSLVDRGAHYVCNEHIPPNTKFRLIRRRG